MRTRNKIFVVGIATAAALALAVSTTSANRLSISSIDLWKIWELFRFTPPFGDVVECPVTLGGSFHSLTVRKVAAALTSSVSDVRVGSCVSGTATVLTATLPWHEKYSGFIGTLPNIIGLSVDLIKAAVRIDNGTAVCNMRTDDADPLAGQAVISNGTISEFIAGGTVDLEGSFVCEIAGSGEFEGVADMADDSDDVGLISVNLI